MAFEKHDRELLSQEEAGSQGTGYNCWSVAGLYEISADSLIMNRKKSSRGSRRFESEHRVMQERNLVSKGRPSFGLRYILVVAVSRAPEVMLVREKRVGLRHRCSLFLTLFVGDTNPD